MKKQLIYENDFETAEGLFADTREATWWVEDSKLYMDDVATTQTGITVWIKEAMPEDVQDILIEYNAMVVPPKKCSNMNLFYCAKTKEGAHILDGGFNGVYEKYHDVLQMYTFTYCGAFTEIMPDGEVKEWNNGSNMRRDPGFVLMSGNSTCHPQVNVPYKFEILKKGDQMTAWANGEKIHEYTSPNPLTGGCIGFRTWKTKIYFEDIKVYKV